MTTKEFIGYYKIAKDKKAECEKHIKDKYIPFITKISECTRVVKATMEYKGEEASLPTYSVNTPMRYLIFNMTLLKLYSDLIFSDNLIDEYDLLNECGALDILIACIPVHEFKEFSTLLTMCVDDYLANNRELTAYFDNKLSGLMRLALASATNEETGDVENG